MKLLLDVGNTSTTWGLAQTDQITEKGFVSTHPLTSLGVRIQDSVKITVDSVWVASVVRGATPVLEKTFSTEKLHRILPNTIRGVANRTLEPEKVGVDRLVNVKAALKLCKPPFVIVDSGTAITLCAVSAKGEYLGGAILPGMKLSRDVLSEKTSLLPSVDIRVPDRAIGRNTEEALLSGIVLAASHSIRGLYHDFVKQLVATGNAPMIDDQPITFIGTGGNISLLAPLIPELTVIDADLTLKGVLEVANE